LKGAERAFDHIGRSYLQRSTQYTRWEALFPDIPSSLLMLGHYSRTC